MALGAPSSSGHVLVQHRLLEPPQLLARLQPELLLEKPARSTVGSECVGLTLTAVEREHELAPESLPERMLGDVAFEFAHELGVEPELELRIDPPLDCADTKLLETPALPPKRLDVADVGKRAATPERKSLSKPVGRDAHRVPRKCGLPFLDKQFESSGVEPHPLELEHVATPAGSQRGIGPHKRAQPREVRARRLGRSRRRSAAPELVD